MPYTGGAPAEQENPLQRIEDVALRAAVVRVLASQASAPADPARDAELSRELVEVARFLERSRAGLLDAAVTAKPSARREHLVELLRRALLDHWCSTDFPADAQDLLGYLTAFEAAREAHAPLGSAEFGSALSVANGFQLVVEVAHDLRSPLTAILFLSEALQLGQSGPVTDAQRQQLGIIYTAALGLISLASDVIELAQDGQQLAQDAPTPFAISQVFTSIRDVARPMAEEKGLAIRLRIEGEDSRNGFPVALSRVLLNLTTNALKFTAEGYVEIAARAVDEEHVMFTVTDTGTGLDEETLQHLYQPFRRSAARGTAAFSGSGLGLAICRKLVAAMNSELTVRTSRDEGTCFAFTLHLPRARNTGHIS